MLTNMDKIAEELGIEKSVVEAVFNSKWAGQSNATIFDECTQEEANEYYKNQSTSK